MRSVFSQPVGRVTMSYNETGTHKKRRIAHPWVFRGTASAPAEGADENLHLRLTPTDLSSHDLIGSHNRYLYGVEMALCIKHHTTPRTPCPILVEQRVTRKTILAFKVPASRVHPGFSNADDLSLRILWRSWLGTPATCSVLSGHSATPSGVPLRADDYDGW